MMEPRIISDPESFSAFRASLASAGLPHEDLNVNQHVLIGYYNNESMVGTGGLEIYGDYALLRSVSIDKNSRGKKLGTKIAAHLISKAKENDLKGIYLLTETAKDFFQKIGFEVIDRIQVADVVRTSSEFSHVCPVSATCMYLDLRRKC